MFISALNDRNFSMKIREAGSTSDDGWKRVFGKEAAAVNPLAAVNQGRNSLILSAVKTNDWSSYHAFEAKQHPAWYEKVGSGYEPNKLYYANLIDVQNRSLQEAVQGGDKAEIAKRQARLDESIGDFKKAPGDVPYVVAFSTNPELAQKHGIEKPADGWFDSPYNSEKARAEGRFEDDYWYNNPYFEDHPNELAFALEAAQEMRPDLAKIAATINKGAYERNAASSSFAAKPVETASAPAPAVMLKPSEETEAAAAAQKPEREVAMMRESVVNLAEQQAKSFGAGELIANLFRDKEETVKTSYDFLLERLDQQAQQRRSEVV